MRTRRFVGVFVVGGLTFISSASALTRYVNVSNAAPAAPYTNWSMAAKAIQPAIDAAASGDEILVAPGTYYLSGNTLVIPQVKTLTLRSTQSRAAVIDAQRLSMALQIQSPNSLVEGFTIRNGLSAISHGGVYITAACTLRDCLVVSNQAYGGGGIEIYANGAVVENCTIQSNLATDYGGGVVFYNNSTSRVQNCIISDNVASDNAGGIYFQGAGSVSNCYISGNRALGTYGGGLYLDQGGELVNSVVVNNYAKQDGGGVYSAGTFARMNPIVNCTIVSNVADREGGGINAAYNTIMVNDIIYFNAAPTNQNLYNHGMYSIVSNCCLTPDYPWPCITNAPAFVDAGAGDFRLATASFCIDAGTTNRAPQTDIDGNPRPRQGIPSFGAASTTNCDMGAYEYGFHFNSIAAVSTNAVRLQWDVQDRSRYRLDAATNAAANPLHPGWNSFMTHTQSVNVGEGHYTVYTTTVTNPTPPMPSNVIFRLSIDRWTPG